MADLPSKWNVAAPTALQFAAVIRHFDRDVTANAEYMKSVLAADPDLFYAGVIESLRVLEQSRSLRVLVSLLIQNKMLERVLCDAALTVHQATVVAGLASEIDAQTELQLARRLADGLSAGEGWVTANAPRLLAILAEISDGSRILPSLARLLHSSSPYLRSKTVLMIARGNRSPNWVQSRMVESDPRIRANAIEALWGVESSQALILLRSAARDNNNRVAGNALLGLYRLGECEVLADTRKMAAHSAPQFRATAAWVMGKCADPRFREPLADLLKDPTPMVRSQALRSLGNIKMAGVLAREGAPLRVSGLLLEAPAHGSRKGCRRLRVSVSGADGVDQTRVTPIQFIVSEDGQPVLQYRVLERPAPEAMSVVFVLPRQAEAGGDSCAKAAMNCLQWKRSSDLWSCLSWLPDADGEDLNESEDPLVFTGRADTLAETFSEITRRADCGDLWHTWWRALRSDASVMRGKRHIIVAAVKPVSGLGGHGLAEALEAGRGRIQVIASQPNRAVDAICRKTRTSCVWAADSEAIASAMESAYLNLLARYEIEFQPRPEGARQVEIKVQTKDGWGETVIPITARPEGP